MRNLHLDSLLNDTKQVKRASEALFASLSPEQLTWKPKRGVWSILECFDHLYTTNELYIPRVEKAIDKALHAGRTNVSPFKPSLFGRFFINSLRPESKMKMKTFGLFKPKDRGTSLEVTHLFLSQQDMLSHLIRRADECDINSVKFSSPVSRLIRFSIGEGLSVLVVHEQRHLLQAQNRQLHIGFPEFQQENKT